MAQQHEVKIRIADLREVREVMAAAKSRIDNLERALSVIDNPAYDIACDYQCTPLACHCGNVDTSRRVRAVVREALGSGGE